MNDKEQAVREFVEPFTFTGMKSLLKDLEGGGETGLIAAVILTRDVPVLTKMVLAMADVLRTRRTPEGETWPSRTHLVDAAFDAAAAQLPEGK